ncbi:MAG: type III secretion system chaperone, partial [Zoogloeaceae bacterium]|nr:type III secretion system chaperone [Zoogloeaceae bacterium]
MKMMPETRETNAFSPILARLGEAIGIPDLALDEDAACMLEIDGQLFNLQWFEERETLAVYAVVGAAEHGPRALPL